TRAIAAGRFPPTTLAHQRAADRAAVPVASVASRAEVEGAVALWICTADEADRVVHVRLAESWTSRRRSWDTPRVASRVRRDRPRARSCELRALILLGRGSCRSAPTPAKSLGMSRITRFSMSADTSHAGGAAVRRHPILRIEQAPARRR